jgi:hypothetical protein
MTVRLNLAVKINLFLEVISIELFRILPYFSRREEMEWLLAACFQLPAASH